MLLSSEFGWKIAYPPVSLRYAARTELRKLLTSTFNRLLSEESDCAADSPSAPTYHFATRIAEEEQKNEAVRELAGYGCQTQMHVVGLLAPQLAHENHTRDIDFSPSGIRQRWEAGFTHTREILERAPWIGEFDPLSGVILHEQT